MLYCIADSNENNRKYSETAPELYVDKDGNCYEEVENINERTEFIGRMKVENTTHGIGYYIENGYHKVDGFIIGERWDQLSKDFASGKIK